MFIKFTTVKTEFDIPAYDVYIPVDKIVMIRPYGKNNSYIDLVDDLQICVKNKPSYIVKQIEKMRKPRTVKSRSTSKNMK